MAQRRKGRRRRIAAAAVQLLLPRTSSKSNNNSYYNYYNYNNLVVLPIFFVVVVLLLLAITTTTTTTTVVYAMSTTSTTANKNRVVIVGSANHDLTTYTPVLPAIGETVIGADFQTSCGGKGCNQACAAGSSSSPSSSSQHHPVSMICKVGRDSFGTALLNHLRNSGCNVDVESCTLSRSDKTSTGVAAITVDTTTGDNMIIVTPGANHKLTPSMVDIELNKLSHDLSVVVCQLEIKYESALRALQTGKDLGALTILNPAPAPEGETQLELLDKFFQYTDIFIPNETELYKICGKTGEPDSTGKDDDEIELLAQSLLDKGVGKAVVVTLGSRGAMIVSSSDDSNAMIVDAPSDLPARDLPVVDTIGAGDAFCGALASYLSIISNSDNNDNTNTNNNLKQAATYACGFASMSVRNRGATYPTFQQLPQCLLDLLPSGDGSRNNKDDDHSNKKMKLSPSKTITFVTGNKKKLEEVKKILSDGSDDKLEYEIVNQKIDLPELQGDNPIDIAKAKCRHASNILQGQPCFIEDTSLCFNSLNGMPGPYVKWFLEKCGHDGLNKMLAGYDDKTAYAQTVIAYSAGNTGDEEIHVFEGRTDGTIVPARGPLNFGWDPIFEPLEGQGKTYAEMSADDKNAISHRGRSFAKFRTFLTNNK